MSNTDKFNTTNGAVPEEHERRFFPDLKTFVFDPNLCGRVEILQGYLEDRFGTRLRDEENSEGVHTYSITRKTGKGVSRTEDEKEISKEDFDRLWREVKYSLEKTRYFVPWNEVVAQVNVYHGKLDGYVQIEVEFATHEEAVSFIPPKEFGDDVTDDSRHGNGYLAKNGKDFL